MCADLYHSVYDVSVSDHAPIYLLVTLAAAAMLAIAYRNVEAGSHFTLAATRKTGRYAASKSQADTDNLISQGQHTRNTQHNTPPLGAR